LYTHSPKMRGPSPNNLITRKNQFKINFLYKKGGGMGDSSQSVRLLATVGEEPTVGSWLANGQQPLIAGRRKVGNQQSDN
jgi:hypothetical protein